MAPLVGIAFCFVLWVQLRPAHAAPKPVVYTGQSSSTVLLLLLAAAAAAFVLTLRKDPALTPAWDAHFATLTLFLLAVPYIVAYPFVRMQTVVSALVVLTLTATLWKGTETARPSKDVVRDIEMRPDQRAFPKTIPVSGGPAQQARPESMPRVRRVQPRST